MILIGVLAATVGPFLFGPGAFVLALACFLLALVDPVGRRLERRRARQRARSRAWVVRMNAALDEMSRREEARRAHPSSQKPDE